MKPQRILIPSPDGGLRTSLAPTLIADNELSKAENVEWVNGKIRKRPGTKDDEGSVDSGSSYPRKAYNFVKSNGTEVPIKYDRSSDGTTPKVRYASTGAAWTWGAIQYSGADMVLNDARAPAFLTIAGKLLISNGDYESGTPANTQGLIAWSGTGNAAYVWKTDPYHSISVRHLCYYNGHVVGAYGYVCTSNTWDTTEYTSGIFYSENTDSDGDLIDPDSPEAWRLAADTMYELVPEDGSWITGLWVRHGNLYISKETGIWVIFGDIRNAKAKRLSKTGIPDGSTLEWFNGMDVFLGKDGFYGFDGQNEARRIDDAISNLVPLIPSFDIDGDGLELDIRSRTDWENTPSDSTPGYNAESGTLSSNIRYNGSGNDGYIDINVQSESAKSGSNQNTASADAWSFTTDSGFALRIDSQDDGYIDSDDVPFILSSVTLPIKQRGSPSGTISFYFVKGTLGSPSGQILDSVTDVDVTDLPTSIDVNDSSSWYNVDFGADIAIEEPGYYWIMVRWSTAGEITYYAYNAVGSDYYVMRKLANGNWSNFTNKKGAYIVYETTHYDTGYYHTDDTNAMDFGSTPDKWGYFKADTINYSQSAIQFHLRTSADKSSWTGWLRVYPDQIIGDDLTLQRYVDLRITLNKIDSVTSPQVWRARIFAFAETGEEIERLIYSATFNGKYMCATNENLDGEYRTYVLDEAGRWAIYPDQYIRGYMEMEGDTYLLTVDTYAQFHRMLKGTASDQFDYDYSVKKVTSNEWYYMDFILKKLDGGFPGVLKRFRQSIFDIGSIFADTFVIGIIKYRTDDGSWTTRYFNNDDLVGDTQVFRMQYSEIWGYYIEFNFLTYYSGSTEYGSAYNYKDMTLDFFTYNMKPMKEVTSSAPSTGSGHLVE